MHVRPFADADWPSVWAIIHEVVRAQETFAYDPDLSEAQARELWIREAPGATVVADDGSSVLGTAVMGPNRAGPGAHVATASFMVAADARRRGVGDGLCRFALDWAREKGFAGMQFNAVVEGNPAVALYERLGFELIGTVPGAFAHPTLGRLGLHVMYLSF